MWIIIVLGAMVFVFARTMRVEVIASGNRLAVAQANAVELAGEQYVLSQVDNIDGEADYVLNQPGEALQVGNGFFWLMRPAAQQNMYEFGLTDECGKVNLNTATQETLIQLPGMTSQAADSIIDWVDVDENVTNGDGAESQFYEALPEPYQCKNQPIETPEELMLVNGVDQTLLFGIDRNRNGVIEPAESGQGSTPVNSTGSSGDRGIYPFVTVFSMEPQIDMQGNARVNVNPTTVTTTNNGSNNSKSGANNAAPAAAPSPAAATPSAGSGQPPGKTGSGSNANVDPLVQALTPLGASRASQIATQARARGPFRNIFDFAQKVGLSSADLRLVADKLTTSATSPVQGLVNVNTAPREVLVTLPGLSTADADALIAERQQTDTSSIAWVSDALGVQKAALIGQLITNRSFIYSADIVAVSGDGRAFKRVRIVVDAQQSPAKIVYRKDLTSYGWPLPAQVRDSLRAGRGPGASLYGTAAMSQQMGAR